MRISIIPVLSLTVTLVSARVLYADSAVRREDGKCFDTLVINSGGTCIGIPNWIANCNSNVGSNCCTTSASCADGEGGYALNCTGVHVCTP